MCYVGLHKKMQGQYTLTGSTKTLTIEDKTKQHCLSDSNPTARHC